MGSREVRLLAGIVPSRSLTPLQSRGEPCYEIGQVGIMALINPRSQPARSTRSSRCQRAGQLAVALALSSAVGVACGTGPIGGGTGGGGNECIEAGDTCRPGTPINPDSQCVVGVDCCRNTCSCGNDGKVTCELKCDPNDGSGGACGGDGGPGARCGSDSQCGGGLKCCYPCGIEGCENQCMAPMPNGQCPLFP